MICISLSPRLYCLGLGLNGLSHFQHHCTDFRSICRFRGRVHTCKLLYFVTFGLFKQARYKPLSNMFVLLFKSSLGMGQLSWTVSRHLSV